MDRAVTEERQFGALLRHLRLAAGLSREALAERAGVSAKAVAALERGERASTRPTTLGLLADALQVAPEMRADLLRAAGYSTQVAAAGLSSTPRLLDPSAAEARLVTLVGPGGVGKTRLALEIAAQVGRRYRDGAVFVDLAPLHDPRLVAATIARALEVREAGGRSAQELLRSHLAKHQMLVLLDNFEHVLAAAPLVADLLASCAELKLLVTSRSALRVRGEHRLAVAPLATAEPEQPLVAVAAAPAVRLFVERAQAVVPEFALTAANAGDVARICGHLDGLPLAIELAAARVGVLQPGALLRRLEHRLASLTRGAAELPERQRTLSNTLAWSYDLLEPAERVLFRRLAVFAGSFTLEAAETVCGVAAGPSGTNALDMGNVLDLLTALVDHSLVRRLELPDADAAPRFGLLQTIQEYAAEQLAAGGEAETITTRHRDWYLDRLERAQPQLATSGQVSALDLDQDNYRAALRWSVDRADAQAGLRLGVACWRLWYWSGRYTEGRVWLDELLALASPEDRPGLRAQALAYAGHLAYCQGDSARARQHLEAALSLARTAGDRGRPRTLFGVPGPSAAPGRRPGRGRAAVHRGAHLVPTRRPAQHPCGGLAGASQDALRAGRSGWRPRGARGECPARRPARPSPAPGPS